MAPPSSCHISGIFSLSEGSRNTEPRYYATYLSALEFTDDEKFINVSIRKFTASADILYADNSFIFLVAKAALPAGEDGILDSIYCAPFISPPEGFQPPSPAHTASVTGTVSSVNTSGSTRSFTLTTSEYVRDERRTFTVRFEYDGTSNRWKNVRLPVTGSTVMAIGIFQDILEDGHGEPVLNLLDISYGIPETAPVSPTRTIGHRKVVRTPTKSQASSSPSNSQPSAKANGDVTGAVGTGKTAEKRPNEEEEGVEGDAPKSKRPRTRKAKALATDVIGGDLLMMRLIVALAPVGKTCGHGYTDPASLFSLHHIREAAVTPPSILGTQKLAIPRIIRVESRTLKRRQFDRKSFYHSHDTAITANILIGPFTNFTSAASSTEQEAWEFLWPSDRFCLIGDILYDYRSEWSVDFTRYNVSLATHLTLPPFKTMNPPLRSYYFSPLNDKINSKLQNHDQLLNVHNVEVQPTRIFDILTTFHTALYDQSRSSLLLFAESLRSNTKHFPLNYATDMDVERLSSLYTISFSNPRLDPAKDGDFCVYFALETAGAETLVSDLALFIRTLGWNLIRWSVLGDPHRLGPNNPAHPVLRDLAYCWDGVACAYGVLQFGVGPVSVMNIRRVFHRTSRICGPFCQAHRYEYFANGIFSDVERAAIPQVFTEMEVAAQELCDNHTVFVDNTDSTKRLPC